MAQLIKENGKMIKDMGVDKQYLAIKVNMTVIGKMTKRMVKVD